jgi:hypothetical protein
MFLNLPRTVRDEHSARPAPEASDASNSGVESASLSSSEKTAPGMALDVFLDAIQLNQHLKTRADYPPEGYPLKPSVAVVFEEAKFRVGYYGAVLINKSAFGTNGAHLVRHELGLPMVSKRKRKANQLDDHELGLYRLNHPGQGASHQIDLFLKAYGGLVETVGNITKDLYFSNLVISRAEFFHEIPMPIDQKAFIERFTKVVTTIYPLVIRIEEPSTRSRRKGDALRWRIPIVQTEHDQQCIDIKAYMKDKKFRIEIVFLFVPVKDIERIHLNWRGALADVQVALKTKLEDLREQAVGHLECIQSAMALETPKIDTEELRASLKSGYNVRDIHGLKVIRFLEQLDRFGCYTPSMVEAVYRLDPKSLQRLAEPEHGILQKIKVHGAMTTYLIHADWKTRADRAADLRKQLSEPSELQEVTNAVGTISLQPLLEWLAIKPRRTGLLVLAASTGSGSEQGRSLWAV